VLTEGVTNVEPVVGSPFIVEVGVIGGWNNPPFWATNLELIGSHRAACKSGKNGKEKHWQGSGTRRSHWKYEARREWTKKCGKNGKLWWNKECGKKGFLYIDVDKESGEVGFALVGREMGVVDDYSYLQVMSWSLWILLINLSCS